MSESRFQKTDSGSCGFLGPDCTVIVDKVTGVNYLFVSSPSGGGLTPLLGRDGLPVISPVTPNSL